MATRICPIDVRQSGGEAHFGWQARMSVIFMSCFVLPLAASRSVDNIFYTRHQSASSKPQAAWLHAPRRRAALDAVEPLTGVVKKRVPFIRGHLLIALGRVRE